MASMGAGYGSECHLLRYLGRHRRVFDARVGAALGGEVRGWLDQHFDSRHVWPDAKRRAFDFVEDAALQRAWSAWWPEGRSGLLWDAVGRYAVGAETGWLLVEARAHLDELAGDCRAKPGAERDRIEAALAETKAALGVEPACDWRCGVFPYASRLAALHFLTARGVPAMLLHVYFSGDRTPSRPCPADAAGWADALAGQEAQLGVRASHPIRARLRALHLPVVLGP